MIKFINLVLKNLEILGQDLNFFPISEAKIVNFDAKTSKIWLTNHNWWYKEYKTIFSNPKKFPKIKLSPNKESLKVKVSVVISDNSPKVPNEQKN